MISFHRWRSVFFYCFVSLGLFVVLKSECSAQPEVSFNEESNPSTFFPKISLNFKVKCNDSLRTDLMKENFTLRDDGIAITNFTLEKSLPNYVFFFDCSAAMAGTKLQQAKECAKKLVDLSEQSNCTVTIISFADTVQWHLIRSTNRAQLKATIDALTASGGKKLWDNLYEVIDKAYFLPSRLAFIAFTDGIDNLSGLHTMQECIDLMHSTSWIRVNSASFGSPVLGDTLRLLSESTDGKWFSSPTSCSAQTHLFALDHLWIGTHTYVIHYEAPVCPEVQMHNVELTIGTPSSIFCCTGTATAQRIYSSKYYVQEIQLSLDTMTVMARERTTLHLTMSDTLKRQLFRPSFKLTFDTTLCRFISFTKSPLLPGLNFLVQRVSDGVILTKPDSVCIDGTGLIGTVEMEAGTPNGDTDCPVELSYWNFSGGKLTARTDGGLLRILSHWLDLQTPIGSESYCPGDVVSIEWNESRANPIHIELSSDGGKTYSHTIAQNVGTSPYLWTIPATLLPRIDYRIRVREANGALIDSMPANFTIKSPPSIAEHPASQTQCEGNDALFSVRSIGFPQPVVQWQQSFDHGISWEDVFDATREMLLIRTVQRASHHRMRLRAIVTNNCGVDTTDEAILLVPIAPRIVTQTTDTTVCERSSLSLSVQFESDPLPAMKWYRSLDQGQTWAEIPNAIFDFLELRDIQLQQSGEIFRISLTNECKTIFSAPVSVTVLRKPSITNHPMKQTVCVGQPVTIFAQATGDGLSYQWIHNRRIVNGATSRTLRIDSCTSNDDGFYSLMMRSACGELLTDSAELVVHRAPAILAQPQPRSVCESENATLSVQHYAMPNASVQWQWSIDGGVNFSDVIGATMDSLSLINLHRSQNGHLYRAMLSNQCGAVTSNEAKISVSAGAPKILTDPISATVCEGDSAVLSVLAVDAVSSQWKKNGIDLAGETKSVLKMTRASLTHAGNYSVRIANGCGSALSLEATLSVLPSLRIIEQPSSLVANENDRVEFRVRAIGVNLSFQWLRNGQIITGATDSVLTLQQVSKVDEGDYTVRVQSVCGGAHVSTSANLRVTVISDIPSLSPISVLNQLECFPNPVSASAQQATITFTLPVRAWVKISIVDDLDREVAVLVDEVKEGGANNVVFNPSSIRSGSYYYVLQTSSTARVKKFFVIR